MKSVFKWVCFACVAASGSWLPSQPVLITLQTPYWVLWDFIYIYMNIRSLESLEIHAEIASKLLASSQSKCERKWGTFFSSELGSVWYLGVSWALRDAFTCSGAVVLCISPLSLTLNLSPSSSAACWESRGLFAPLSMMMSLLMKYNAYNT